MPDYNFQTLNDREFEKLTKDLLQKELSMTFESFKPGRDGGIDLRHISPTDNDSIVVQAKHWSRSNFKALFSHLEKEELKKVKKIKPSRYILVTSTEFNPAEKRKIKELFAPFILNEGDIYGKDDLNGLLGKFSDIEIAHSKLWLSSVPILRKIISNGIKGRSDFEAEAIQKNISLYVANKKYSDSLNILNNERFLVIIGEPGIGKTVLARMLVYQLLSDDYKLVTINEKISEAEDLWDANKKQVFYFDDFLGANYLEIIHKQNGDSALVNFIKRVKNDPTKRLILTSRTTILNRATQVYPHLESPVIDIAKHEVKIEDYSKLDRAHILYNHLYFLGLPTSYLEKIKENKNYWKIINHDNYNPRLVEFITDPLRLQGIKPEKYMEFIQQKLDNPIDIWQHPYQHQTDDYCKFLIQTLFSLGENVKEQDLKRAFNARLDYEILNNGFKRESDVFALRIKDLLGGFLSASRNGQVLTFNFFNPSIVDFLMHTLKENNDEKWRIVESVISTDQLNARFSNSDQNYLNFSDLELPRLRKILIEKEDSLVNFSGGSHYIELLFFYYLIFPYKESDTDCARILEKVDFNTVDPSQDHTVKVLLEEMTSYDATREIIESRWREIMDFLFASSSSQEDMESIQKIFEDYGQDYENYISNENSKTIVETALNNYWDEQIDEIENGEDVSLFSNVSEVESHIDDVYKWGLEFNKKFGFSKMKVMDAFDEIDPEAVAETVQGRIQAEDYMSDNYKEDYKMQRDEERSINRAIDELFE